jgi:AcrR family transcriptional regulator
MADSYHHGDLRDAVLRRAIAVIATEGPHHFSLRSLAADLGVSHTAPRHHFGDRQGVLNAIAAEGFSALAEALDAASRDGGTFLDQGVAYVTFAVEHPAHFQVMFTPTLLDESDEALATARDATFAQLRAGVDSMDDGAHVEDAGAAVVAAWALVHGIATLGAAITRRSAALLYGSPGPRTH